MEVRVFVTAFDPKGSGGYEPIKPRTVKDEQDLLDEIHALDQTKGQI